MPQFFKIPPNLLWTSLTIFPCVKIHPGVGKQQVEAVHCFATNGFHDWCLQTDLVDGGQVLSGKERGHLFMVGTKHSMMKSTTSKLINFVDVNLWLVEQQLHHIVVVAVITSSGR